MDYPLNRRRYLIMLIKGGMYTDSDTAPLSDPNLWGTNAHTLTPPSLRALQRAMRHLEPSTPEQREVDLAADYASNPIPESALGINNPKVSMVISVEYDVHHPRQDERFGYTRDLQIVQWTFMVGPPTPPCIEHTYGRRRNPSTRSSLTSSSAPPMTS